MINGIGVLFAQLYGTNQLTVVQIVDSLLEAKQGGSDAGWE
jgi:hypothetical protein